MLCDLISIGLAVLLRQPPNAPHQLPPTLALQLPKPIPSFYASIPAPKAVGLNMMLACFYKLKEIMTQYNSEIMVSRASNKLTLPVDKSSSK
jgi:hypothetical protein